jgi:protein tyrosine phosphatase
VSKNRFKGVLLYDRTRVVIKDKRGSDYYHASFVDSYEKKGSLLPFSVSINTLLELLCCSDGYILAQAPFDDNTESDFWRLVFKFKPMMIVLLGSLMGADGTPRIKSFWPKEKQERQYAKESIRLRCLTRDQVKS